MEAIRKYRFLSICDFMVCASISQEMIKQMTTANKVSYQRQIVFECIAVIAMALMPSVVSAQISETSQNGFDNEYTLRLNADMVILSATVLNSHKAPVSGLNGNDFRIYENGALQKIRNFSHEDVPVTVGILVDNSGSMGPKREDVIAAGLAFAESSNPLDEMFVVNFNDQVSFGLAADIPFTDRQDQLRTALIRIRTIGQTALYDGIAAGLDHLKQGSRDRKVLILITDGGDTASKLSLAQAIALAKQSAATIYAIGIFDDQDGDRNPAVLERFAKQTGGEAFFPQSSREIVAICRAIARDIKTQYTLTYIPTIASLDAGYRTIDVKASSHGHGRFFVRTRAGYAIPLSSPATTVKAMQP